MKFEKLASQTPEQLDVWFTQAAARSGILSKQLFEKDFWVCWTLKRLFEIEPSNLIFKGGTSLSKVYDVVQRFSEDVDLVVDRSIFSFDGENDPEKAPTRSSRQKRIKKLQKRTSQWVQETLQPSLEKQFSEKLEPNRWQLTLDENDKDCQTLLFHYPQIPDSTTHDYIAKSVKIEVGSRSDNYPTETGTVTPYLGDEFAPTTTQRKQEPSPHISAMNLKSKSRKSSCESKLPHALCGKKR